MRPDTWAEIHFTPEMRAPVITLLLSLATDKRDVRTVGGKNHLLVPDYLADAYAKAIAPKPRKARAKKEEADE